MKKRSLGSLKFFAQDPLVVDVEYVAVVHSSVVCVIFTFWNEELISGVMGIFYKNAPWCVNNIVDVEVCQVGGSVAPEDVANTQSSSKKIQV